MNTNAFLGLGLGKALSIALFTMVVIVGLKVITTRYPVNGLTEFVNAV